MASTHANPILNGEIAEASPKHEPVPYDITASPFDEASLWSRISFGYGRPLLRLGSRRPLQEADLPALAKRDNVITAISNLEVAWAAEQKRAAALQPPRGPNFVRAIICAHWRDFYVGALLSLLEDCTIVVQVLLVRPILAFVADSSAPLSDGLVLASLLAATNGAQFIVHHQNFLVNMRLGWAARTAVTGLLHGKLLQLSSSSMDHADAASVYNLVAADAQRFDSLAPMLHMGWTGLLVSITAVCFLARELGWASALCGSTTMVAFVALQMYFGKQFGRRRSITAKITDARVRLTGEMLAGVASVKAYAWESPFLAKLSGLRRDEHASIFVSQSMKAATLASYFAAPALTSLVTFSTYVSLGNRLEVSRIYASVALINVLRLAIGAHFAKLMEFGPETLVACRRMQNFLLLPEIEPRPTRKLHEEGSRSSVGGSKSRSKSRIMPSSNGVKGGCSTLHGTIGGDENDDVSSPLVVLEHANFGRPVDSLANSHSSNDSRGRSNESGSRSSTDKNWNLALVDINLTVSPGEVCVVCGPVGCGKSTLLNGMLGEVDCIGGRCSLEGSQVAYSPQEAWILTGTLQDNILFGSPLDAHRLSRVLNVCCLEADVAQLPNGLETEIGEKGVNLSGGQKARVSLARACYAKATVVLLDDPLSAVDPSVAKHLFSHCIKGWLVEECKCAVVLVTHQRQFLKAAHRVVLLEAMRAPPSSQSSLPSSENECGPPILSLPGHVTNSSATTGAARLDAVESEGAGRMVANGTFEELLAMKLVEDVSVSLEESQTIDMEEDGENTSDDHDHHKDDGDDNDLFDPLFGASAPTSLTALTVSVAEASSSSSSPANATAVTASEQNQKGLGSNNDLKTSSSSSGKSAGGVLELVHKEDREVGVVSRATWWAYVSASGVGWALLVLCFFVAGQACLIVSDWWLVVWAKADDQRASHLLYTFIALCVTTVVVSFSRAWLFFFTTLKASSALHQGAAASLFASPLSFFAATPSGRILNRFSADLAQVDEQLAVCLFDTLQIACITGAGVVVACVVLPPVIILVPPVLAAMVWLRSYTTTSMRELKRLEGVSKSPVFSTFRATMGGLACIRAYGAQANCQRQFVARLNRNATSWYWWLIANRWFGFWLDALCCLLTVATAFAAVLMKQHVEPGLIGLALVYVLALSGLFQYMMRQSALVETFMTSVERLNHYANSLESEEATLAKALPADGYPSATAATSSTTSREKTAKAPPASAVVTPSWPQEGALQFDNLRVRYRKDLPEVLKGISADLTGFKKIGVVGRTGSGKSSLLLALARLNEISGGRVLIDGVDTTTLSLETLRNAIAVIPQEPHLFSGTVRFNLDPFNAFSDASVWTALEATQLKSFVAESSGQLEARVTEGGSTWSAGQRQLLSLARALLHRRSLVLLDEATASVDHELDQRIQRMLRTDNAFAGATIVVIAHRIDTILDSDVVLVLEHGQLVEIGPPQALIAQNGAFAAMVTASKHASKEQQSP